MFLKIYTNIYISNIYITIYIYIANIVQMEIIYVYEKMHTGLLICLLVQKCLCVSISRGKPSIYFLLNIGYPLRPSRRVPS